MSETTLAKHNSETGEYTIYARVTGAVLLDGNAEFAAFSLIEEAIRKAERIAYKRAINEFADETIKDMDQRRAEFTR